MRFFLPLALPVLAVLTTTTGCHAAPQAALTLAQNGQSDYVITLANDAIPAEKTAASELQKYLKQSTGATLPIKAQSEVVAAAPQILVSASTRARKRNW